MKETLLAENKALREINQRLQAEIDNRESCDNDCQNALDRIAAALETIAKAMQSTTKYHEIKEK